MKKTSHLFKFLKANHSNVDIICEDHMLLHENKLRIYIIIDILLMCCILIHIVLIHLYHYTQDFLYHDTFISLYILYWDLYIMIHILLRLYHDSYCINTFCIMMHIVLIHIILRPLYNETSYWELWIVIHIISWYQWWYL